MMKTVTRSVKKRMCDLQNKKKYIKHTMTLKQALNPWISNIRKISLSWWVIQFSLRKDYGKCEKAQIHQTCDK